MEQGKLLALIEQAVANNEIYAVDGTKLSYSITGVEVDPDGDIKLIMEVDGIYG